VLRERLAHFLVVLEGRIDGGGRIHDRDARRCTVAGRDLLV